MTYALPDLDPLLSLAQSMAATPSSHAVVLGAGVSVAAGVPSAWSVQLELIDRIARQEDADPSPDPVAWFQERFGVPARYETLIAALAKTQTERQRLLRGFFEPTEDELEDKLKQPTDAHRAIARLVASGHLRVVVTLNFDRLVEKALREMDIEPTVVATVADIRGLPPLHTVSALVVHLHGDYLMPASMLNTEAELVGYAPEVDQFLDGLFANYGVIAIGWSATYDPALREAIGRSLMAHFTSYWVEPHQLSEIAERLRANKRMALVRASADEALGTLADAVAALSDRQARHPLTVPVAVATAKRQLAGRYTAIGLHDALNAEFTRIRSLPALQRSDAGQPPADQTYQVCLAQVEEGTRVATALAATAAYWGNEATDDWWLPEIERFARPLDRGGNAALLRLHNVPALHLHVAALVASVASGRLILTRGLLDNMAVKRPGGGYELASTALDPRRIYSESATPSARLHDLMRGAFVESLGLNTDAYDDAWETVEVLRMVVGLKTRADTPRLVSDIQVAARTFDEMSVDIKRRQAMSGRDEQDEAELKSAQQEHGRKRGLLADRVGAGEQHIRVREGSGFLHESITAVQLIEAIRRRGEDHPLVQAGFGAAEELELLLEAVNLAVGRKGHDQAVGQLPGGSGVVPSYIWLDTGQRPNR